MSFLGECAGGSFRLVQLAREHRLRPCGSVMKEREDSNMTRSTSRRFMTVHSTTRSRPACHFDSKLRGPETITRVFEEAMSKRFLASCRRNQGLWTPSLLCES